METFFIFTADSTSLATMLNRFNAAIVKFTFTVLLAILVSKIDAQNQPLTVDDTSSTTTAMMVTDNDDYTTMMGTDNDDYTTVMMETETETSDSTTIPATVPNASITIVALSNSNTTINSTVASNTTKTSNITLTTTGHGIALYPSNLLSFVSISLFLIF